jgi:hypothetical protein
MFQLSVMESHVWSHFVTDASISGTMHHVSSGQIVIKNISYIVYAPSVHDKHIPSKFIMFSLCYWKIQEQWVTIKTLLIMIPILHTRNKSYIRSSFFHYVFDSNTTCLPRCLLWRRGAKVTTMEVEHERWQLDSDSDSTHHQLISCNILPTPCGISQALMILENMPNQKNPL